VQVRVPKPKPLAPPIPAEENAWIPWSEIPEKAFWLWERDDVAAAVEEYLFEEPWLDEDAEAPAAKLRPELREVLLSLEPHLDKLAAGVVRGRFQLPRRFDLQCRVDAAADVASQLRGGGKLLLLRAKLDCADGQYARSGESVATLLQLRRTFLSEEPTLGDHLFSVSAEQLGLDALRWLARHRAVPDEILSDDGIDASSARAELKRAWGGELQHHLNMIEKLPDATDLDALVREITAIGEDDDPDDKTVAARKQMVEMLADHPRAFDRDATKVLAHELFSALVAQADRPWTARRDNVAAKILAELDAWPRGLRPNNVIWTPMVIRASTLRDGRRALRRIDNPAGKMLVVGLFDPKSSLFADVGTGLLFRALSLAAERAATRVVLALRRHERRTGKLPATLEELVASGLLDSVPDDPFGSEPLRYARERRQLWSVGENSRDDGGIEAPEEAPGDDEEEAADEAEADDGPDDLVWRLPPPV